MSRSFGLFGEFTLLGAVHAWQEQYRDIHQGECLRALNDLVIMQFTGLVDKNGVEIYEGDIVSDGCRQNDHCISGVHVVELRDGAFFPFAVPGWEGTMSVDKCQVIGNIHQNPELLK
jgi:uncharacterized phage protein (TIGR01671 family)